MKECSLKTLVVTAERETNVNIDRNQGNLQGSIASRGNQGGKIVFKIIVKIIALLSLIGVLLSAVLAIASSSQYYDLH